ncbi:hypothetical protein AMECASPLE_001376 [Ameca splendens]|uniref:Uncharacterized protein n=1 Tax=Ameca splendens TaxID=208324 RepID=A0ABV0Y911_9TELE
MLLHKDVALAGRALRCKSQLHHSSAGASEDVNKGGEGELLYCSAPGQCSQSIYISTLAPALPFVRDAPPCCCCCSCCCCCCREVTDSHTGTFSRSGHTETTSTLVLGTKEKLHQMKCIIAQKQSF